jgi:4,5:9,10-diseco-3-hydroxy-5,9,17-trioxoandrosta-1(10),2-diene-4-oate hydrolase
MRHYTFGLALGLVTGALAITTIALGHRRLDEWETLTPEDAPCGDFAICGDARMRYIQRGERGAHIVLIHGLMDSAEYWQNNIDALAERYRVWAIDLIGFGYSSRITTPVYSLQYFANAVRAFMDTQNIERAHIVGHSLGGAVALQLARTEPARVDKLVLIAPGTFLINYASTLNPVARVPHLPRAMMGFTMTNEQARQRAWSNALGHPKEMNPADREMQVRPLRVKGTADALLAMAQSDWLCDLGDALAQIEMPTLIVWGDRDWVVPVSHAHKHARALPNAELAILKSAGHLPHIEYPHAVNRLMLDFLRETDLARGA